MECESYEFVNIKGLSGDQFYLPYNSHEVARSK